MSMVVQPCQSLQNVADVHGGTSLSITTKHSGTSSADKVQAHISAPLLLPFSLAAPPPLRVVTIKERPNLPCFLESVVAVF